MNHLKNKVRLVVIILVLFLAKQSVAQFVTKVLDYLPAPGQYTNAEYMGTPAASRSITGTNRGLVSLGAYGGSIVVHFASGIQNDPANPYGVDFTVYGNATPTWSEPGIIQVMKDENGNGLPDETWYEIAGSDHFWDNTITGYGVTYLNSGLNSATNITWNDNLGHSGYIPENSFHLQTYYPTAELFPAVDREKYTLGGTRLMGYIDLSNPGTVISYRRTFGYADNTPVLSVTEKMPDNPYTPEIEGSGGDAIDISWAIDHEGHYVNLDQIHFIRIYTGMNDLAGWLGEISTEITGIRDIEPASASGTDAVVVIRDLPSKVGAGETLDLNAILFKKGLRQPNSNIIWTVDAASATLENGKLKTLSQGIVHLKAYSADLPSVYSEIAIEIYAFSRCSIGLQSNVLKVNDRVELTGKITDQDGNLLSGIAPVWRIAEPLIAEIRNRDGRYYLEGKQPGESWLYMETSDSKNRPDSVLVQVLPESAKKKVFVSVKTGQKTLIPRESLWVDQFDFTNRVDRAQKDYGLTEVGFVSLAHAIVSVFQKAGYDEEFAFRDDVTGGSALYLWKVPEEDEGSVINIYGYGGSQLSEAYKKTWVVMINQQALVSGFDQVKVNNNDEILIYHVADNSAPWTVTQLLSSADSVKTGSAVEIQLKKYSCEMGLDRKVLIHTAEVVTGQQVKITNGTESAELNFDELGKVSFVPHESGIYSITSGIDSVNVLAELPTVNRSLELNSKDHRIFPNPFSDLVTISGDLDGVRLEIFDLQGRQLFSEKIITSPLNLSRLQAGIYLFRLSGQNGIYHQKIVKQ